MQPGILITNNHVGNHSPDSWAMATAEQIIPIKMVAPERALAGRQLQMAVAVALVPHHEGVQTKHTSAIADQGSNYLWQAPDHEDETKAAFDAVIALTKGTPWEDEYDNLDVQQEVKETLLYHFNTSHHIELSAHCDRNPNDADCQIWRAQHHPGTDMVAGPDGDVWFKSKAFDNQEAARVRREEVNGPAPVVSDSNLQQSGESEDKSAE